MSEELPQDLEGERSTRAERLAGTKWKCRLCGQIWPFERLKTFTRRSANARQCADPFCGAECDEVE